jgi:membrane-bound lytic murein transglycosylase D
MSTAEAARRVAMAESDLRSINGIPPRMLIKAGSALIVPRSTTSRADVAESVADNGQISLTPEQVTRRTTVRARKNESVASIARRYRVSAANVADWNDVKASAAFKVGEQVVLFVPVRAASPAQARSGKRTASKSAPVRRGGKPSKVKRR